MRECLKKKGEASLQAIPRRVAQKRKKKKRGRRRKGKILEEGTKAKF